MLQVMMIQTPEHPLGHLGQLQQETKRLVSEQANCSRQKEQLHKLSCRNAEMTAIQETSHNTEAIPPHCLSLIVSSDVPVGATTQMNNNLLFI